MRKLLEIFLNINYAVHIPLREYLFWFYLILSSLFLCVWGQGLPIAWYLLMNDITTYKNCLNGSGCPPSWQIRRKGERTWHHCRSDNYCTDLPRARIMDVCYRNRSMGLVTTGTLGFWLSWSHLAIQNWVLWLTSQAKLVSCLFDTKGVTGANFNSIEMFIELVSTLNGLGMSVNCRYHVIVSSLL